MFFQGICGFWTEGLNTTIEKLLREEWPQKRNIIIQVKASSVEEGRVLLKKLRDSVPK